MHCSGFLDFLNPAIQDIVASSQIIVYQRNLGNEASHRAFQYWQGMGKPVLVDLDDMYQALPWSNPAHRYWHEKDGGRALEMLEEGLRRSDGLVSPNRNLLNDWSHVTKGSYYLPNYAEQAWWTGIPTREELKAERGLEDRTVIGWGGSVSHYDSWWGSGIKEAARRVSKRHPEVLWLMCGNDPRIHDQLPVPRGQKAAQRGVPPEQWPRTVSLFDVGVAPLFGPYDQRRSWIKGLEYLLGGVPFVATGGEPYRDLMERGLGHYVRNGADEWEEALEAVLSNLEGEQAIASQRVPVAQQWFVQNQLHTFRRVYGEAIQRFTDDHAMLSGVWHVEPDEGETSGS